MEIPKKIMSESVKYFKEHGVISSAIIMRKFKIECKAALHLSEMIKKRFPNLWREGRERMKI